ncbi:hypothetical protein [Streptomyces sp. NPDC007905]|uniref:hypothetical protein n=1 Tax=Streptomyces sp. NPDC007905 TaxID=3364788 RepID=UPI0036EF7469
MAAPGRRRVQHSAGLDGAARAAGVWVLASQLAVKQGRTTAAGAYAGLAGVAARRSGEALVLAAAARAAATPLRHTGRADEALQLLHQARAQVTAVSRPTAAELEAVGMAELTAAYTRGLRQIQYRSNLINGCLTETGLTLTTSRRQRQ